MKGSRQSEPVQQPLIIPRSDHCISRAHLSDNALKVLYRLNRSGYQAFLVGGAVRDLLLGIEPKDFDIVTDARPEEIRKLFRNSRLIGRRFRLAHILFGREIIEVATFRGAVVDEDGKTGEVVLDRQGRILRDNVYGTIDQDVWRRDFTTNALYYNIADFTIWDYVGGVVDTRARVLRLIGEPQQRYREDPVRMLRAMRFASKLAFSLESETEKLIANSAALLDSVPPARLLEECLKLFLKGHGQRSFELLYDYGLFRWLFPQTEATLDKGAEELIHQALVNTDQRVAQGKPVSPVFLFAVLLWEPVRRRAAKEQQNGASPLQALQIAATHVLDTQQLSIVIPRRLALPIRDVLVMQGRFTKRVGKRVLGVLAHDRFRAGYDLLLLRAEAGQVEQALADWWTEIQTLEPDAQRRAIRPARRRSGGRRGRGPRRSVGPEMGG